MISLNNKQLLTNRQLDLLKPLAADYFSILSASDNEVFEFIYECAETNNTSFDEEVLWLNEYIN